MRPIRFLLRQASPVTIAREALWRANRQWKQYTFPSKVSRRTVPHKWSIPSYYNFDPHQCSRKTRTAVVTAADLIGHGQFPVLGFGNVPLSFPPHWNEDVISGETWSRQPAPSIQVVRYGSDVKVPWELSRLQVLPVLGKAYRLTGNDLYRALAMRLVDDWRSANPVGIGVNWTVAMEAALRLMSICFLVALLRPARAGEQAWFENALRSVWEHLVFIEHHLEFSHLARGNHYFSNLVGLLCASCFLNGPGMKARRLKYKQLTERELLRQVYADGGNFEASVGYHVFIAQLFATAVLLMRAVGLRPIPASLRRLSDMASLVENLATHTGELPHVGDCDDGRSELLVCDLERVFAAGPHRSSLWVPDAIGLIAAVAGRPSRFHSADAYWYGLPQASQEGVERSTLYPATGIAIARNGVADVVFFAMPNAIHGRGSHTHNDKLSILLRLDDQELFTDSGTGGYTRDPALRNLLRGTPAHTTVMVDGLEQNTLDLRNEYVFCLGNEARVTPIELRISTAQVSMAAAHHGYKYCDIVHHRTVELGLASLHVRDEFSGFGDHSYALSFIVPSCWRIEPQESRGQQVMLAIHGNREVEMSITARTELSLRIEPVAISRSYGTTEPACVIRVGCCAPAPMFLETSLEWK